jgi:metal-responsive CopG/Arc/MetJ family transcriptional regulator
MKTKIAITIESEVVEKIDKMAKEFELSRSQLIENLLSIGLSDAKVLKVVGLVDLAKLVMRVKDKVYRRLSSLERKTG